MRAFVFIPHVGNMIRTSTPEDDVGSMAND